MLCGAENDGPSLHYGTHVCRTRWPHDKHRCAVCGFGWPIRETPGTIGESVTKLDGERA